MTKALAAALPILFAAACGTVSDDPEVSNAASATGPAVAHVEANGNVVVNTDVLRKTFDDGGPIAEFKVRQLIDGPFLVRRGHSTDGHTRTDGVPLILIGNRYFLPLEERRIMLCLGGCSFCGITYNHDSCECSSGANCDTGWIDILPSKILTPLDP